MAVVCARAHACSHLVCVAGWNVEASCVYVSIFWFVCIHTHECVFTVSFCVLTSRRACMCACVGCSSRNARRSVCKDYIAVCFSEQPLTTLQQVSASALCTHQPVDRPLDRKYMMKLSLSWSHSRLQHSCEHLWPFVTQRVKGCLHRMHSCCFVCKHAQDWLLWLLRCILLPLQAILRSPEIKM